MTLRRRMYLSEGKKDQAVSLVKNLLLARRNGNVKQEQKAYEKLREWCEKNGFDLEDVIMGATAELKKSVAASMGGLV